MLLFEGQKAPVTQSKRRGFGLAVHIPVLKEKKPWWDCRAAHGAQRALPASQEGEAWLSVCEGCWMEGPSTAGLFPCVPESTRGLCGWKWLQVQLLSHPLCRTHLWTAAHLGALTACPPPFAHRGQPDEAGGYHSWREGRDWASHFICWASRRPWTFPVLARPLKGSLLFYNKSKFYALSELIWIGFGEKSVAPAEVHWLHRKTGSFPHVKKWPTVDAIVRDRQNSNRAKKTLSSVLCKDIPQHTQFKALDDWREKVWGGTGFHSWLLMLQRTERDCLRAHFVHLHEQRCSAALWLTTEPSSASRRYHCLLFMLLDTFY